MGKQTLEQILAEEKQLRHDNGEYGIKACKESIKWRQKVDHESLYQLLEDYVRRANEDVFFNKSMVLACWELINGKE